MFLRKKPSTNDVTIAGLKKSVGQSILYRLKIRLITIGSRIRRLYHDYRMPALVTLGFIALLVVFGVVRQFEKTSLLSLRNIVSGGGSGYSLLLRDDEADEFTRNDTTEDSNDSGSNTAGTNPTNSTQSTSNSFVINPDTPTTGGSNGSGSGSGSGSGGSGSGSGGSGDSGGSGGGTTTPPPFSAGIDSFSQIAVTLQCANPSKPNKGSCAKVYSFGAGVRTINGPGTVTYAWVSSADGGSGTGNFSIADTEAITTLSKEFSISCNRPTTFSMQFRITSPTDVSSNTLTINHNCNEL